MVALSALLLIDRGAIDRWAPVSRYWPEFEQADKDGVVVTHLVAHTSGLSGWDQPVDVEYLYDWAGSTGRLAAQAPWWEPGTAAGYHALSYGHLVGEVIRRVTGKMPAKFFAEELAGPLGADPRPRNPSTTRDPPSRFSGRSR